MTQEDKKLLLQDLSARLPYGVKAYVKNWSKLDRKYYEGVYTVESIQPSLNIVLAYSDKSSVEVLIGYDDYVIKPYLIPIDMMTEEQKTELNDTLIQLELKAINDEIEHHKVAEFEIDFYNKNHIDYRGLIPMGLANDATGLNIY